MFIGKCVRMYMSQQFLFLLTVDVLCRYAKFDGLVIGESSVEKVIRCHSCSVRHVQWLPLHDPSLAVIFKMLI